MSDNDETIPGTTLIGLSISLLVPFLLLTIRAMVAAPDSYFAPILVQMGMWGCAIAVLLLVTQWENRPLRSIGLKPPTGISIALGLLAYGGITAIAIVVNIVSKQFGVTYGIKDTLVKLLAYPWPVRLFFVVTAAFVEEVLFRGYPIERLLPIVKSRTLAALIPLLVFTFGHQFSQQPGNLITVFIAGACLSAVYLWKRDLTINITAHFMLDLVSVLLAPILVSPK